jgi:RND family efflux transporter MFP subunit
VRGIDRGALITSGSGSGANLLFRIAHIENLRIFVNVPQTFVRSIVPGQEAQVLVPEYPKRAFVGKIASTAGALDPTSRTLLTEVRLRNDDHALMPGMYAQIKFSLVPADAMWVIPATALISRSAGPQVLDVRRDGTVHYLGVQLGRDLGQSVEIVAGLSGSERLVVSPPDGLKEGMRVAAEESKRN